MSLGERIRHARKGRRWTQAKLAAALRVTSSAVSQWETDVTEPGFEHLQKIQRLLSVDSHWLFTGGEEFVHSPQDTGIGKLVAEAARVAVDHPSGNGYPGARQMVPESHRTMPVYAAAGGGSEGEPIDLDNEVDRVVIPPELEGLENACGVMVSGHSMEPRYYDGEILHVHPSKPPVRYSDVLIEMAGRTAIVKRFLQWSGALLEVEQYNPRKTLRISRSKVVKVFRVVGRGDK